MSEEDMSNSFRKGDLVKILSEIDGSATGVVIDVSDDGKFVQVWATCPSEHGDYDEFGLNEYKAEDLELIPHPDTVRLDWLEKAMLEEQPCQVIYNGYGFAPANMAHKNFKEIRDAIDEAMEYENG
ncbi:hypothetical protein [Neisseria arctica]|uniref:hypothetical protein n=1 Tax=Neisseria arctica TaxID=1470200 RepID=UPI00128BE0D5|nr:hypothetical protein [Neisseria arctica]UOO87454.1 hypothetical protein LVJ86_04215 [Neisseria arctica]